MKHPIFKSNTNRNLLIHVVTKHGHNINEENEQNKQEEEPKVEKVETRKNDYFNHIHIATHCMKKDEELNNKTFFGKYYTIEKLGEGSFGRIYKAQYNGEYYALKFESKSKGEGLLEGEANILNYLKGPNIPFIKSYGYNDDYNILVMQLLGKSLEDLIEIHKKFSLKTVCLLTIQMIQILERIHSKHIIHRDVKPDNFVMGLDSNNGRLYILDFGLAKKYRSSSTLEHYPLKINRKLTGTARYASINALSGLEQSRRDDLESVGYIVLYFLKGHLPWQGLKVKSNEDKYQKILEKKKFCDLEIFCQGMHKNIKKFLEYTRNLEYAEEPKYQLMQNFFLEILKDIGEEVDFMYDWTTKEDLVMRNKNKDKGDGENYIEGIEEKNLEGDVGVGINGKTFLNLESRNEINTDYLSNKVSNNVNYGNFNTNNNLRGSKNNNIFEEECMPIKKSCKMEINYDEQALGKNETNYDNNYPRKNGKVENKLLISTPNPRQNINFHHKNDEERICNKEDKKRTRKNSVGIQKPEEEINNKANIDHDEHKEANDKVESKCCLM